MNLTDTQQHKIRTGVLWIILFMIPIAAMGWAVGSYGPIADDWDMLLMSMQGDFFAADRTRPLAFVAPALTYFLGGGQLNTMMMQAVLLHGVEAILIFEVLRRVFARLLGNDALFAAFAGAAIYVLYPADVIRYPIVMIHGRYVQIAILLVAWMWLQMGASGRRWWMVPIFVLTAATLMTKEHGLLLYGLFPVLLLLHRQRPWSRRWLLVVLIWYVALAAYGYWRFFIVGSAEGVRGVEMPTLNSLLISSIFSFYSVMIYSFPATIREHAYALSIGSPTANLEWVILAVAVLLIFGVGRITRSNTRTSLNIVPALIISAAGFAVFMAGLVPYLFWSASSSFGLAAIGQLSRYTQIANFGAVLLWIALPLLFVPLFRRVRWLNARVLIGVVTVILVTVAALRQIHVGEDYVRVWTLQRQFWSRIIELPESLSVVQETRPEDRRLFILKDFLYDVGHVPVTGAPWSYDAAFALLVGRDARAARYDKVEWLEDEQQFRIFAGHHSVPVLQEERYAPEYVRVLDYDPLTANVQFAAEYTDATGQTFAMFTGLNERVSTPPLTDFGVHLFGQVMPPTVCRTSVIVTSITGAPYDGHTEISAEGRVIDRRPVEAGEALDFNLLAPCGVSLTLTYHGAQTDPLILGTLETSETLDDSPAFEVQFDA